MNSSNVVRCMIVGDSIAACWPSKKSGFRGVLDRELKGRPIEWVGPFVDENGLPYAGFHGYSAARLFDQAPELVSYRPDLVLFSGGLNGLPDQPASEVGDYVNALAQTFLANGTRAFHILGLTDVRDLSPKVDAYNEALSRVPESCQGAHFHPGVGAVLGRVTPGNPYFVDECHPSDLGHEKLAREILRDVFQTDARPSVSVGGEPSATELWQLANDAFKAAYPSLNDSIRQAALAIGYFETKFGQVGSWAPGGDPSNNWGALVYRPGRDPGYIIHGDQDAQGNPTAPKFAKYPTLQDGAIAFFETWAKPDTYQAAANGDTWGIAKAMYVHHYYTGTSGSAYERILAYARGIQAIAVMGAGLLGEKPALALNAPPAPPGTATGSPFSGGNLLALVGAVGIFAGTLFMKSGPPRARS